MEDWVDVSVAEAVSEARRTEKSFLHVDARVVDAELPLHVFDSSVSEVHFFAGRERTALGLGVARVLEPGSLPLVRSAAGASEVSVMGGWGFQSGGKLRERGAWRDFPASHWIVPAITLKRSSAETRLVLAVQVSPSSRGASLRAHYRRLARAVESPRRDGGSALPSLKDERSVVAEARWLSLAQEAIDSISRDELKKVVLSRAVALAFKERLPASRVLRRLVALNPDSTVFAIKRNESVFMGATPESLLSLRKGEVLVDCLAASSPRGNDAATDEALGELLLKDPKSASEHQVVVRAAVSALSSFCSRVEVPGAPVLRKLATIQHLYTPVRASPLEGEDLWDVARALWPSPAIGGEPKERAIHWIRRSEGVERGWYSGVVGLLSADLDEAELVVAIRSGLIRGRRALIYAGAGLVAASVPAQELEETRWKLRTMKAALGLDLPGAG